MVNKVNVTIFGKGNRLTFGKYKGQLVEDVIQKDPEYFVWAHNNIEWFELEEEAMEDVLLVTTGKTMRKSPPLLTPIKKEGAPSKEDTPVFDKSKEQRPKLFDDFDDFDDFPF